MSKEPAEHSLRSLCLLVVDCPHATPKWTDSGVVVLRNQNIKGGRLDLSSPSFTDEEHYQGRVRRAVPQGGDIVMTREAPMGDVCQIPQGLRCCVGQRQVLLRPNPKKVDGRFLLFALQSPYLQHQIGWNEGTGSTVSNLRIPVLEALRVPTPSLPDQLEIAATLVALDDRIALLRETNATLEAIAQALFKSWFVDFDAVRAKQQGLAPAGMDEATAALFPDSFEESALGPVPQAWGIGKVEDLLELAYGKALKATDRVAGDVPVYGSGGVTGLHNCALVEFPTVVVGRKGTVGSLYWEDRPCFPIDTVFYVRARVPLTFCFYQLRVLGLEGMNTDGAVPGLNRNNVYRLAVVIPPPPVFAAFDDLAANLRSKIFANETEAQTLATLRDTPAPRLISGQMRQPEAEALAASA
jgi:type I restriction enzyme, S subunit